MSLLIALVLVFQAPMQTVAAAAGPAAEYIVGPQDRLSVTVFEEAALTKTVTVDADGTFDFPLIGRVRAAGLTVRTIQQDVTARLKKDFLVNPQVTVEVETYRSQLVYVTGQVRTPGPVPLMGNMTVMEALARAGSPREDAGPFLLINHRPLPGADPVAAQDRLSMADLLTGKAQGIVLRDGDTIFVPKAEAFFVTGQVRNPGPYLLDSDITIARAVSMAGGITERGSRSRIRVTRTIDGRPVVLKSVKLEDLVLPGDSIEVLTRVF